MLISIIGTAGRGEDATRLNREVYFKMYKKCLELLAEKTDVQLQSGGAAWGDHLAVSLFLNNKANALLLNLPCAWDDTSQRFVRHPDAKGIWAQKTPDTANYYHEKFSTVIKHDSFEDIHLANHKKGCMIVSYAGGFFVRNSVVATCDILLAFTFGEGSIPKDGGTRDTWDKSRAPTRIHVPIASL